MDINQKVKEAEDFIVCAEKEEDNGHLSLAYHFYSIAIMKYKECYEQTDDEVLKSDIVKKSVETITKRDIVQSLIKEQDSEAGNSSTVGGGRQEGRRATSEHSYYTCQSAPTLPSMGTFLRRRRAANGDDNDKREEEMEKIIKDAFRRELQQPKPTTKWQDVIGCEEAKMALMTKIIYRVKYPHLCPKNSPPSASNACLFGPPGCGKSLLVKALAEMGNISFISVSPSDLMDRYVGGSEKKLRYLFEVVRENKPCVLFIDEIETLLQNRESTSNSGRFMSEFLTQTDGVKSEENKGINILAATNMPWTLDDAVRRRFGSFIHVKLPNEQGRVMLLRALLGIDNFRLLTAEDINHLKTQTKGFSNSDLSNVVDKIMLMPMYWTQSATHFKRFQTHPPQSRIYGNIETNMWVACSPTDAGAIEMKMEFLFPELIRLPPLTRNDIIHVINESKTTSGAGKNSILQKCADFDKEHGSKIPSTLNWDMRDKPPVHQGRNDDDDWVFFPPGGTYFQKFMVMLSWVLDM